MNAIEEITLAQSFQADMIHEPRRGCGWYKFILYGWTIWKVKDGWKAATLVGGEYQNHVFCETLQEAFEFALE